MNLLFFFLVPYFVVSTPSPRVNSFIEIGGRAFHIDSQIGRGSSEAEIFKVHEISTKNVFALKEIDTYGTDDLYGRETTIFSALKGCSHVIQLVASQHIADFSQIVLELGDSNLLTLIRKNSYDISNLFSQMVLAVEQLHAANVVHTDLKLDNFLIIGDVVKVFDFDLSGIVSANDPYLVKSYQEGTPDYMSPESVTPIAPKTFKVGKEADIWALGVILYEMVYRVNPFQHIESDDDKIDLIADPNFNFEFPPVSSDLEIYLPIIKSCLQRDISLRPTIETLKETLINLGILKPEYLNLRTRPPLRLTSPMYTDTKVVGNSEYGFLALIRPGSANTPEMTKVVDVISGTMYTMKEINLNQARNKDEYLNELEIQKRLQSVSYVTRLINSDILNDEILITVQEYADKTLSTAIQENNYDIKKIWEGMLLAINSLHEKNVIHTMPIPSNFWLIGDSIKIENFRLAQIVSNLQPYFYVDEPVGNPDYMSPELLDGAAVTKKTDVWSLGVVLYQLLYGKLPFGYIQDIQEKTEAIVTNEIEFPKSNGDLDVVVKACLRKNPEERPSVKQLLEHLEGRLDLDGFLNDVVNKQRDQKDQRKTLNDYTNRIREPPVHVHGPGCNHGSPDLNDFSMDENNDFRGQTRKDQSNKKSQGLDYAERVNPRGRYQDYPRPSRFDNSDHVHTAACNHGPQFEQRRPGNNVNPRVQRDTGNRVRFNQDQNGYSRNDAYSNSPAGHVHTAACNHGPESSANPRRQRVDEGHVHTAACNHGPAQQPNRIGGRREEMMDQEHVHTSGCNHGSPQPRQRRLGRAFGDRNPSDPLDEHAGCNHHHHHDDPYHHHHSHFHDSYGHTHSHYHEDDEYQVVPKHRQSHINRQKQRYLNENTLEDSFIPNYFEQNKNSHADKQFVSVLGLVIVVCMTFV